MVRAGLVGEGFQDGRHVLAGQDLRWAPIIAACRPASMAFAMAQEPHTVLARRRRSP